MRLILAVLAAPPRIQRILQTPVCRRCRAASQSRAAWCSLVHTARLRAGRTLTPTLTLHSRPQYTRSAEVQAQSRSVEHLPVHSLLTIPPKVQRRGFVILKTDPAHRTPLPSTHKSARLHKPARSRSSAPETFKARIGRTNLLQKRCVQYVDPGLVSTAGMTSSPFHLLHSLVDDLGHFACKLLQLRVLVCTVKMVRLQPATPAHCIVWARACADCSAY